MLVAAMIKHYKIYEGIKFIPITDNKHFSSYIGDNGIGKSTVLESIDTFFEQRKWNINKQAISKGYISDKNVPYIMLYFVIEKEHIKKKIRINENLRKIEKLSEYFWNVTSKDVYTVVTHEYKLYEEYRDKLKNIYNSDEYFLLGVGRRYNVEKDIYFGPYHTSKSFLKCLPIKSQKIADDNHENIDSIIKKEFNYIYTLVCSLYSYVYIPSEIDISSFTKLETLDMQKIMNKDIKKQINDTITVKKVKDINTTLSKFVDNISKKLDEYSYIKPTDKKGTIRMDDLVHKIIEIYFEVRILNKRINFSNIPVSQLSSGEKRKALIDLAYAFLHNNSNTEKKTILAIDEPESSLHVAACFDQFEKLKKITETKHQVLLTTHWYGFLPIVYEGYAHYLFKNDEDKVNIETLDLTRFREQIVQNGRSSRGNSPFNINLKSTNDLVQSLVSSLQSENPYNWILCEGSSEFIYFSYFFKNEIEHHNLRILPLGGCGEVRKLYSLLEVILLDREFKVDGRIIAIVDTDAELPDYSHRKNLKNISFKRIIFSDVDNDIVLVDADSNKVSPPTEIEDALHPEIFIKTLSELCLEVDETQLIKEFRSIESFASFNSLDLRLSTKNKIKEIFKRPNWCKLVVKELNIQE